MAPPTIRSDANLEPGGMSASPTAGLNDTAVSIASWLSSDGGDGAPDGVALSAEPETPAVGDGLGVVSRSSTTVGAGVGSAIGRVGAGDLVAVGACVGTGVGAAVGGGGGAGAAVGGGGGGVGVGGGAVTVTIGPSSGSGGSLEVVAWNVTCQVPAGSVDVPCQVPSWAVPLTLVKVTVALPTAAQTACAGRWGSVEV